MLKCAEINSGSQPADGVGRNFAWTATERSQVRKILTWIGTDGAVEGAPFPGVDVYTSVYGPAGLVSFVAFDHYCNWVGVHQWREDFEPNQLVLEIGQAIGVGHCARSIQPPPYTHHSHTIVFVWYEVI